MGTCLSQFPQPPFQGGDPAFVRTRAHGHRFAVLRPASDDALLLGMTTSVGHNWRLLPDTIVSIRHAQREKPNNLKLIQQTKVLIRNQLADKAKARLPTFSHNLHLDIHSISLTFSDIHQKPTYRLFDSIQFCVASFLVTHRIFL